MSYSSVDYKGGNILALATFLIGLYILLADGAIVQGLLMAGGAFLASPRVRTHLISVRPAIAYGMIGLSFVMAYLRPF